MTKLSMTKTLGAVLPLLICTALPATSALAQQDDQGGPPPAGPNGPNGQQGPGGPNGGPGAQDQGGPQGGGPGGQGWQRRGPGGQGQDEQDGQGGPGRGGRGGGMRGMRGGQGMGPGGMGQMVMLPLPPPADVPAITVAGNFVFVVQGGILSEYTVKDLKLVKQVDLPKPVAPANVSLPGFGGPGRGRMGGPGMHMGPTDGPAAGPAADRQVSGPAGANADAAHPRNGG